MKTKFKVLLILFVTAYFASCTSKTEESEEIIENELIYKSTFGRGLVKSDPYYFSGINPEDSLLFVFSRVTKTSGTSWSLIVQNSSFEYKDTSYVSIRYYEMNKYRRYIDNFEARKEDDFFRKFDGYFIRMNLDEWEQLIKKSNIENYIQTDTVHYESNADVVEQYTLIYNNKGFNNSIGNRAFFVELDSFFSRNLFHDLKSREVYDFSNGPNVKGGR